MVPSILQPSTGFVPRALRWCGNNLNFFRVHVLVFTFTPLIAAAIFYACNGETYVKFIDALFLCTSAMTVTGLVTVDVSTTNGGQQAILFILMCIGNISAVSVTMVWIRRHFFRAKFDHIVKTSAKARKRVLDVEEQEKRERKLNILKLQRMVGLKPTDSNTESDPDGLERSTSSASSSSDSAEQHRQEKKKATKGGKPKRLRADMIRRLDGPAFLINQAGVASTAVPEPERVAASSAGDTTAASTGATQSILAHDQQEQSSDTATPSRAAGQGSVRIALPSSHAGMGSATVVQSPEEIAESEAMATQAAPESASALRTRFPDEATQGPPLGRGRRVSDPPQSAFRRGSDVGMLNPPEFRHDPFPRAQTVEFAEPREFRSRHESATVASGIGPQFGGPGLRNRAGRDFDRTMSMRSHGTGYSGRARTGAPLARTMTSSKQRGLGGFPTPVEIAGMAIKKAMPRVTEKLNRSLTMPRTSTVQSIQSGGGGIYGDGNVKSAPYLSFDATVAGNSRFVELTEAQRDELGGVEYRAIDLLAKVIPAYWLFLNLFFFTLVAPYINSNAFAKYRPNFDDQGKDKPNYTWFWLFQVVSAYTNTGQSLVDTSMTGMQDAYFLLIPMGLLILAGNTAFPIFLRFFIWCFSLLVPRRSRLYETIRFVLDHPRRCFVYLFPSSQTRFLLFVLIVFNSIDWVAFLVLDIGNPVIESIPVGTRIFDGLFQSIAVRAAGFQVVSLLTLAPAVQFLYVIMMYLSPFPLALSVRSTNVYEEKSLGIYESEPQGPGSLPNQNDAKVWGSFLAAHARRQLAFDIWWLGFALWLVCIVERHNIEDPSTNSWFTIFSCLFELTSAYGTVGLSTGTPTDSFSLSGRFSTLSKLIVIAVMIRGRHRGLPVAIDRAVLLPSDLELEDDELSQYVPDEDWDRMSTQVSATAFGMNSVDRHPGMPNIVPTQSAVSFADSRGADRRGSSSSDSGSQGLQAEGEKRSSLHLGSFGAAGGKGLSAPLSAIKEVPMVGTPLSMSRDNSFILDSKNELPQYQSAEPTANSDGKNEAMVSDESGTESGGTSLKGKEKEVPTIRLGKDD